MPSTRRSRVVAAAVLTAAATATIPAAAGADPLYTAPLTVLARAADGTTVYPQPQPDGSMVLSVPHDGTARTIELDASGSVAMSNYTFDVEGNGQLTAAPNHGPELALTPAFDRVRTSTAYERGGANLELSTSAALRWQAVFQPTVRLSVPAVTRLGDDTLFDASDAAAWNGDGTPRAVARWEWELPDGTISTSGPRLLHRFDTTGPNCLTVRAVDVSGAQSEPATACTTVARPVVVPSPATQAAQPVTQVRIPTQAQRPSTTTTARIRSPAAALLTAAQLTLTSAHVTGEHTVRVRIRSRNLPLETNATVRLRQRWGNGTFRVGDVVTRRARNAWVTLRPYADTRPRTTEIVAEAKAPDGHTVTATATIRLP